METDIRGFQSSRTKARLNTLDPVCPGRNEVGQGLEAAATCVFTPAPPHDMKYGPARSLGKLVPHRVVIGRGGGYINFSLWSLDFVASGSRQNITTGATVEAHTWKTGGGRRE